MGTTLTGTTPQDTYDSLIKVTDNGPLSGTAKYLSDGLGNDSALAVSTAAVGIGTTTIVSGTKLTVGAPASFLGSAGTPSAYLTNDTGASGTAQQYARLGTASTAIANIFRGNGSAGTTANGLNIDNFGGFQVRVNQLGGSGDSINLLGGSVAIGTLSPFAKLHVFGSEAGASPTALLRVGNSGAGYMARMILTDETTADGNIVFQGSAAGASSQYIGFGIGANLDTLKLTGDGYLRMAASTGGIQFNGDTAAANALDDYEEGDWTPALTAAGTAPTGVTYVHNGGTYTKIGRLVSISFGFLLSSKGTGGSGNVQISGLPFTAATYGAYREPNARLIGGSFATASLASSAYGFILNNNTKIEGRVGQNVDTALDWSDITDTTYLSFNLSYYL